MLEIVILRMNTFILKMYFYKQSYSIKNLKITESMVPNNRRTVYRGEGRGLNNLCDKIY